MKKGEIMRNGNLTATFAYLVSLICYKMRLHFEICVPLIYGFCNVYHDQPRSLTNHDVHYSRGEVAFFKMRDF